MSKTIKQPYWIVTADTQLGAIHWSNPIREQDYYEIFQSLCKQAAADPFCLGMIGIGDIRERAGIQAKNLEGMNLGLEILHGANKSLLAVMGNHDYTTPNWIEAMHYPSLFNLTDKAVQAKFGFDPAKTLALDFKPRGELKEAILAACNPEDIEIVFLHQALRELTLNLKQSYDIALESLAEMGFGRKHPCLILIGDLHNYGDRTIGQLTAVYPGSPEMTDINEGTNGLKSDRLASDPHDYRKFAVRYFPGNGGWEPFELQPRPWFRGKAKTQKETQRMMELFTAAAAKWHKPGCVTLTAPKKELENVRAQLAKIPTLEARVEEYDEDEEAADENWDTPDSETGMSWKENKLALLSLGEEEKLGEEPLQLLRAIILRDGSTHNPKNDVGAAWAEWAGEELPPLEPDPVPPTEDTDEEPALFDSDPS